MHTRICPIQPPPPVLLPLQNVFPTSFMAADAPLKPVMPALAPSPPQLPSCAPSLFCRQPSSPSFTSSEPCKCHPALQWRPDHPKSPRCTQSCTTLHSLPLSHASGAGLKERGRVGTWRYLSRPVSLMTCFIFSTVAIVTGSWSPCSYSRGESNSCTTERVAPTPAM